MAGAWDVVEEKPLAAGGDPWAVVGERPVAAPKRNVGAGEAFGRGVGSGFAGQGNVIGLAGAAPFMLADAVANLFRSKPTTSAQDFYFGNVYEPTFKNAVDAYSIKPDESMGTGATVANVGGNLVSMAPSMVASGGATGPAAGIAANLFRGAVAAQPSFAIPSTVTRAQQLLEAGVDRPTVAKASGSNWVANTVMGALPVSAPGNLATRMVTGAGMNVGTGAAQRAAEGAILGDEYADQAQAAFDTRSTAMDAGIGALMAALLGGRGGPAPAPAPRPAPDAGAVVAGATVDPGLTIAQQISRATGAPDLPADPQARAEAIRAQRTATAQRGRDVREAFGPVLGNEDAVYPQLARTPNSTEAAVRDAAATVGETPESIASAFTRAYAQPDVSTARIPLERNVQQAATAGERQAGANAERTGRQGVIAVDSAGRAQPQGEPIITPRGKQLTEVPGVKASMLAQGGDQARADVEAGRAFDVAEAQRQRKQGGQDQAALMGEPRDLREARAGGTTTPEGTAATAPETFTFFNAKIKDGQMVDGERVEPQGEPFTVKDAKGKDVAMQAVRFVDRDGQPEMPVPASLLSTKARPANPRFAQDVAATTYAPPRGVGTGDQQPAPRAAAQRITTEPSPEFIPGDRPAAEQPPQPTPRAGQDVTDLAFDRLADRTTVDAGQGRRPELVAPERMPARPAEAPDATILGRQEGVDSRRAPEPLPAEQPPTAVEQQPVAAKPKGKPGSAFLREIKQAGGIDSKWAAEVGGDTALVLNRRMPGLFRRGGMSGDALREWLHQNGYLSDADVANADAGRAGGSIEAALDLVRTAFRGEDVGRVGGEEAQFQARMDAEAARWEGYDQPADYDSVLRATELQDLPPEHAPDVDLVAKANEIDADAVERAAMQHADDDAAFMDAVRRIVDEQAQGQQDGGATPDGGRQDAQADARGQGGEFRLEGETEADIRAREQDQALRASEQAKRDAAPPPEEFAMTGSDRPVDQAEARGQSNMFDAEPKPDRPGGGTLYGGLPLDRIARALGETFGTVKDWSDSIGKFAADLAAARAGDGSKAGHPVARFMRAIFDSASGAMRAKVRNSGSKTAQWVLDQFHVEAGADRVTGDIYSSGVNSWTNKMLSRFDEAVKAFDGNQQAMEQIAALVRNPGSIKGGSRLHDAARTIRTLLDEALKHMRDAGVEIGEVKDGYYPREFDMRAVVKDAKGFIDAAATAYREGGMSAADALEAARSLHDGLVFGETGSIFRPEAGAVQAPFLKGRVFGKQVDNAKHPLHRFLMHDPSTAIPIYLERAAKRAEIARRFGDNFAKWGEIERKIIDEGGGEILKSLREYVNLAAGQKRPGVSEGALRAASVARTWGSLMFLEKATLSSLTEFITPAIRSGNVMDSMRSLRNVLDDLFTKSHGAAERRAFAEDLGIISGVLSDQVSAARFSGGEPASMVESKILAKFFRRTGLTQWTDSTFVGAADIGRVFIRRLAKEAEAGGGKLNERYLAELGVPPAQQKALAKFILGANDGMPSAGDLKGPMGELYRTAVRRFVQQSIMRPDATLRPGWMSHPIGAIAGQLQSFNYAFWENVLKRSGRLTKEAVTGADYTMAERARLLAPTLMLPMLTAAAYAIGEARDAAFGDPEKRGKETDADKLLKAASRGMPIAPLDPILNLFSGARYQRGAVETLVGPVLGNAARGVDSAIGLSVNNSERTNTAERKAAKALYDLTVEPTVNLLLYAVPAAKGAQIAAAAATQAVGSGRTRDAIVDEIAGPDRRRPAQGGRNERDAGR